MSEEVRRYSIVLADPPWKYNQRATHSKTRFGGGVHKQYPTMSVKEIAALPVKNIAAQDSILFLWTTGPMLADSFKVISAWGFIYKTIGFTWMKQNKSGKGLFFGTGYYAKHNAEFCLLATRGETLKPATNNVSSALLAPLKGHSEKPIEVQQRIELMYPSLPKLELFARQQRNGWLCLGNEITGNDIAQDLWHLAEQPPLPLSA